MLNEQHFSALLNSASDVKTKAQLLRQSLGAAAVNETVRLALVSVGVCCNDGKRPDGMSDSLEAGLATA